MEMLREALADVSNIKIANYSGLLVDFVHDVSADFIIRGLRNGVDFANELEMAQINTQLAPDVDTIFLPARGSQLFLSSSCVREVASLGGDVSGWVPENVLNRCKFCSSSN